MPLACTPTTVSPSRAAVALTVCCDTLGPTWNTISVEMKRVSPAGGTAVNPAVPGNGRGGKRSRATLMSRRWSTRILPRSTGFCARAILVAARLSGMALPLPILSIPALSLPSLSLAKSPLPSLSLPSLSFARSPLPSLSLPSLSLVSASFDSLSLPSLSFARSPLPSLSLPSLSLVRASFESLSLPILSLPSLSVSLSAGPFPNLPLSPAIRSFALSFGTRRSLPNFSSAPLPLPIPSFAIGPF